VCQIKEEAIVFPFRKKAVVLTSKVSPQNEIYDTVPQEYNRCPNCKKLFERFDFEYDYTIFPFAKWKVCPFCHTRIVKDNSGKEVPSRPPLEARRVL
jgi:hypothetical protein